MTDELTDEQTILESLSQLKKFVVGWWVVCLIIVSTPGPVLTRIGTKPWEDQVRTMLGPGA